MPQTPHIEKQRYKTLKKREDLQDCAIIQGMNIDISIPLDKMTFSEKMQVIDTIWADILRHPDEMEWPSWHETYLKRTEEEIANGTAKFIDFETVEKYLLEQPL